MDRVRRWVALHFGARGAIALHARLRLFECDLKTDRCLAALHHMVGAERLRAIAQDPFVYPGEVTEVDEVLNASRG